MSLAVQLLDFEVQTIEIKKNFKNVEVITIQYQYIYQSNLYYTLQIIPRFYSFIAQSFIRIIDFNINIGIRTDKLRNVNENFSGSN